MSYRGNIFSLLQYVSTATYFARVKVNGKIFRESFGTLESHRASDTQSMDAAGHQPQADAVELPKESAEQGHVPAMNGLAWIRATALDEKFRDGAEALKWGTQACEESEWKEAIFINTLAAACAELDKWDEAVATQQKAIELMSLAQKEKTNFVHGFQMRVEQYRNHQKMRE